MTPEQSDVKKISSRVENSKIDSETGCTEDEYAQIVTILTEIISGMGRTIGKNNLIYRGNRGEHGQLKEDLYVNYDPPTLRRCQSSRG
jgi:hypothetical protein